MPNIPTKIRLTETATRLMKECGYNNVSINELCKALDITRSAFYYHFKTKDEILDTYLIYPQNILEEHLGSLREHKFCRDQFYGMMKLFIERAVYLGPDLMHLIYKRTAEGNLLLLSPRDNVLWKYGTAIIRHAQQTGEILRTEDPEWLTEATFHMLNGIGLNWCCKNGNFDYFLEFVRFTDIILGWKPKQP